MGESVAVVAGASGLVGRRIVSRLLDTTDWTVVALARRPRASEGRLIWIGADMRDAAGCERALRTVPAASHIFYAARFDHPEDVAEDVAVNAAMLENLVRATESMNRLRHVHVVHGTKYYGHQLHPVDLPLKEDSPRDPGPNFYFNQEDFLRKASADGKWSFSTSRPHAFCDPAIDQPRSIGMVFAVYAAVQRELGEPFHFPGFPEAFRARTQFTDISLLARAVTFIAGHPHAAGQAFNVVNGDNPTWAELWAYFAAFLGVTPGEARPMSLAAYMADKEEVWRRVITRHGLRPTDLHTLALWPYGDYQIRPKWDVFSASDALRSLGFTESVDSKAMFRGQFEHYRAEGILP
jgi:nucleoside-diphosphate-sugar epimerase